MLDRWPASVVALAVSVDRFGERLRWLAELGWGFPRSRCVVLAAPELGQVETVFREAGAVEVVYSVREIELVLNVARRHIDRAPEPRLTHTKRILAGLPWSDPS